MKKTVVSLLVLTLLAPGLTVLAAAADGVAGPWADTVVDSSQGLKKNGTAVAADRSDTSDAIGPAESAGTPYDNPVVAGSFYALGFGGWIIVSFDNYIVNEAGDDLQLYEVTVGTSYPDEKVMVEASQDGLSWTVLATSTTRDATLDLGVLPWAQYVRITDVSNPAIFESTADGYDLDGVLALHTAESVDPGCTYTQGFWKNHEEVWPVTMLSLGNHNYDQTALLNILTTPVKGNGLISLAHQLIAAKLNIADGADDSDVSTAISEADAFIGDLVIGVDSVKTKEVSSWVGALDSFNNGLIGPGHCEA